MVKKENISAYFKGKNFYLSLLVGVCAVMAIGLYVNVASNKNEELVDLNEPIANTALEEKEPIPIVETAKVELPVEPAVNKDDTSALAGKVKDSLLENDIVSEPKQEVVKQPAKPVVDTNSVTVMNPKSSTSLKFDEEAGLLWPVTGNVIMDYSMDKAVYFETLAQYKYNPAVLIAGEPGANVLSAAKGVVKEIIENEETGLTLTMSIGGDYTLVYGQLKDCTLEAGDKVAEGDIIGKIAEPTKYYVVEGSNLYFEVLEKGEPVNPMLLLR